jgi:hypothetical protein
MTTKLQRLQVGKARNKLPGIGQAFLVLQGDERKDIGQECVVTKQSAAHVHLSFQDANG